MDLQATAEQLQVATGARDVAATALTQARDRFAAGVATNIEVVQAQEAVGRANEQYINALYLYNVEKAVLARDLGDRGTGRSTATSEVPADVPFRLLIPRRHRSVSSASACWLWLTAGRESTDDAQTECARRRRSPRRSAARCRACPSRTTRWSRPARRWSEIDPRDYQIAVDARRPISRMRKHLQRRRWPTSPMTSTSATSGVTTATGGVKQSRASIDEAERAIEAASATAGGGAAHSSARPRPTPRRRRATSSA